MPGRIMGGKEHSGHSMLINNKYNKPPVDVIAYLMSQVTDLRFALLGLTFVNNSRQYRAITLQHPFDKLIMSANVMFQETISYLNQKAEINIYQHIYDFALALC